MPFILKANDLRSGAVTYWTGRHWSPLLADAAPFDSEDAAKAAAADVDLRRPVVDVYPVALAAGGPASLRERINAAGPTVRPDLARATGV